MLSLRVLAAIISLSLVNLELVTCRSPGESGRGPAPAQQGETVTLPGVDTANLTAREKADWSLYVSELLAPCPNQPVSVADCVKEERDCKLCLPAARFLVRAVQEGKARTQIEAAFRTRFAPDQVKKIELGDSPSKGSVNAPVVIVEWADFECPFCGKAAPMLEQIVHEYPGQVRLVFKHYPLSAHQYAEKAARAAVAAGKQGKFWEMHARLFRAQRDDKPLDEVMVRRLAHEVGLDMKRFDEDVASEDTVDSVSRDRKQADALGLSGTPWIYVNGRHFDLSHFDLERDLDEWLELEIESKTKKKIRRMRAADAGESKVLQPTGPAADSSPKVLAGSAQSAKPAASGSGKVR